MSEIAEHMRFSAKRFKDHPVYDEMSADPIILSTHAMMRELAAHAIDQRDRLLAALDSNETKAAYIGEVKDDIETFDLEAEEWRYEKHTISWTAMKEFMSLIRKRASVE